ncbi:MAG: S49 family peptidase [Gemmatimonadetes bacterium]|nr:S49 family peptidase [Gemmatimonadota bacterium]
MQHRLFGAVLCCLLASGAAKAQSPFISYAERGEFALAAFGGLDVGLYGYANPALLSYVEGLEQGVAWSDSNSTYSWGLFTAAPHLGFGMVNGRRDREYRAGLSTGDRNFSLGVSMGWGSVRHVVLGGIWRPGPRLSVGGTFTSTFANEDREGAIDLSLRPWGDERLTLYADYARTDETEFWSTGAVVELVPGLALTGRMFADRALSVGLRIGLGAADFQAQAQSRTFQTYAARFGAQRGNLFRPRARYLSVELSGPIQHRRYAFFDDSQSLLNLIALLERARRDPAIKGLAINASGLRISPVLGWELREKLRQIRAGGQRVIVYIDRVDMYNYHWASVADHLVLDPAGAIGLQGYVAGHTYFKDALEKLGIGFDEWRLFQYKSATEPYVRRDMSAGEREQLTTLLDDWYALARRDISADRSLAPEQFDHLVEDTAFFLPQEALDAGLVDRLGRWSEIDPTVEDHPVVAAASYTRPADRRWGQRKRIAIVYALGVCAMDTGMGARRLVGEIASACAAADAVVLRVDSPGGDVLPSALVADAVLKCRERKPVIVSQGYLAASGGYMISLPGDAIVTAPNTITGSIGVIAGWAYNTGFKEKLGLSTSRVQVGRHADLPFGMTLPLLGLRLPDRTFTEDESARMEHTIRSLYEDFVAKVASSRHIAPDSVEAVAQGRVWSGQRAVQLGLADRIGGLEAAIALAKEKIGLSTDEIVELIERPRPKLFSSALFRPRLLGLTAQPTPELDYLQFRIQHNGLPLLLVPANHVPSPAGLYGEKTYE